MHCPASARPMLLGPASRILSWFIEPKSKEHALRITVDGVGRELVVGPEMIEAYSLLDPIERHTLPEFTGGPTVASTVVLAETLLQLGYGCFLLVYFCVRQRFTAESNSVLAVPSSGF